MSGPLADIRILDFSSLLPGPMATLLLAEAGADVIKVERPERGDEMRSYSPRFGKSSVNFGLLNRGKKSIAVDLKDEDQLQNLIPLLRTADVIIEGFRPGVMARLNLGYEDILIINPSIIYCSLTGYGQHGNKVDVAGHDLNYIGDVGLLALSMGTQANPTVPPALIADIAGGAYPAVMNILLALLERSNTGEGRYIDVAMADNLFGFMYWAMGNLSAANQAPVNGSDEVTGGSPRYNLYPTADGKMVAAAPLEDKFWEIFVESIGLQGEYVDDSVDAEKTYQQVAALIRRKDADFWEEKFKVENCCCSIVKTIGQALQDPHFQARGLFSNFLNNEAGEKIPALPIPISPNLRKCCERKIRAPCLGEHNALLLHKNHY